MVIVVVVFVLQLVRLQFPYFFVHGELSCDPPVAELTVSLFLVSFFFAYRCLELLRFALGIALSFI